MVEYRLNEYVDRYKPDMGIRTILKRNPKLFKYIADNLDVEERLKRYCIDLDPSNIQYITRDSCIQGQNYERYCLQAVRLNGMVLEFIPAPSHDVEVAAIYKTLEALVFILDHSDEEIQLAAISHLETEEDIDRIRVFLREPSRSTNTIINEKLKVIRLQNGENIDESEE